MYLKYNDVSIFGKLVFKKFWHVYGVEIWAIGIAMNSLIVII